MITRGGDRLGPRAPISPAGRRIGRPDRTGRDSGMEGDGAGGKSFGQAVEMSAIWCGPTGIFRPWSWDFSD